MSKRKLCHPTKVIIDDGKYEITLRFNEEQFDCVQKLSDVCTKSCVCELVDRVLCDGLDALAREAVKASKKKEKDEDDGVRH